MTVIVESWLENKVIAEIKFKLTLFALPIQLRIWAAGEIAQ